MRTTKGKIIQHIVWVLPVLLLYSATTLAKSQSFDCRKVKKESISALVCKSKELSALDSKLAVVYSSALKKAKNEWPPMLKAEQRGWIKGRDECWKSEDINHCIQDQYQLRIAELQARYRLLPIASTETYHCNGQGANEVVVNYFNTAPATAIAEYGDSTSMMYIEKENAKKYVGRNEILVKDGKKASITWGYKTPEMNCDIVAGKATKPEICTTAWFNHVDTVIHSADLAGHGPDIGSDKWKSVVEFKLEIRGKPDVPARASKEWCDYVNQRMR